MLTRWNSRRPWTGLGAAAAATTAALACTAALTGPAAAAAASHNRSEATRAARAAVPTVAGSHRVTLVLASPAGIGAATETEQLAHQQLSTDPALRTRQITSRRAALTALDPTTASITTVTAWAATHGLTVESKTSHTITLTGDPSTLASLFGVRISAVRYRATTRARTITTGVGHTGALAVPAALTHAVTSVVGLDDKPAYYQRDVPLDPGAYSGPGYTARYGKEQYSGAVGAGVRVGIVGFQQSTTDPGLVSLGDFHTYLGAAGLSTADPVNGDADPTLDPIAANDADGDLEAMLDLESLASVAPQSQAVFYEGTNDDAGAVAVASKMADDAAAGTLPLASESYGECEAQTDSDQLKAVSAQIARFTAAGSTFFASSGDSGAYGCDQDAIPNDNTGALAVDYPASDPLTVAVGGTNATTGQPDVAWGDPQEQSGAVRGFHGAGSGGGVSTQFPVPAYQSGVTGITGTGRNVPDIAGPADPRTGFEEYNQASADYSSTDVPAGWVEIGGSSLAAPLVAGWTADALSLNNHSGLPASPGFGDIHPEIYSHPSVFTDITAGNNLHYAAAAGYDDTTGLGVPKLPAYTNLLLGAPFTAPTVTAPTITNTPTITVSVPDAGDRHFTAFRLTTRADSCATAPTAPASALPTTVTVPTVGNNTLTLVSEDELGSCHLATTVIDYDPSYDPPTPTPTPTPVPTPTPAAAQPAPTSPSTPAPDGTTSIQEPTLSLPAPAAAGPADRTPPVITTRITVLKNSQLATASIGVTDTGSGVKSLSAEVVNLDTGHVVLTTSNAGLFLFTAAGGHYAVKATALDLAGNTTGDITSSTVVDAGVDDRSMRRSGTWNEAHWGGVLDLTVSITREKGSSISANRYTVGNHPQRLTVLSAAGNGTMQVLVDGKPFGTVRFGYHRALKLGGHIAAGTHTITLKLLSGYAAVDGIIVS